MQTLDGEMSPGFVWGTALWPLAFWRLLQIKITISHIMINDCLDFHVVNKNVKIYLKVVLEFDFKLSVSFLIVFSI